MHSPPLDPPVSDFHVGDWYVQPRLYRMSRHGQPIQVEPKVMGVLVCLARRADNIVNRDTLMQTVWPDTYVCDDTLTRCISQLRKLFDDDPRQPQAIETIRKVGYRLLLPVTFVYAGDSHPEVVPVLDERPLSSPPASTRRWHPGRLAVLLLLVAAGIGYVLLRTPAPSSIIQLNTVPMTSYPGIETNAALSPDGAQVAFAWNGENQEQHYDIYVKLIGTETPRRLTHHAAHDVSPAWSPDGHRIAFMRYEQGTCSLFVVPAIGGVEEPLGDCGRNFFADLTWSPDGRWLAYSDQATDDSTSHIVLFSPETRELRVLTHPEETRYGDYEPVFSPDGQHIAFIRVALEEQQDLFVVPVEGGAARRLTFDERLLAGHDWTPDGKHLIVASNRTGRFGLWRVSTDGDTPTWMATHVEPVYQPATARLSNRLTFEYEDRETNLWAVNLGTPPAPLIASTRQDLAPHLSPDGQRLAFASNRSGFWEIWTADHDGTHPMQRTSLRGPITGAPQWSPDGRHVAFESRPDGHIDVLVLDVETQAVHHLTRTTADDAVPRWSRDGRWLYFASDRSGRWQVWKMPAEGGLATQVTRHGGMLAREAPDGQSLYFARNDTAGLWQMPIDGGPATLVFEDLHEVDWGNWDLSDDALYFVQRDEPHPVLARYSLSSGMITPLVTIEAVSTWRLAWSLPGLTVSPDGTRLFFTQIDRMERDLMLATAPL